MRRWEPRRWEEGLEGLHSFPPPKKHTHTRVRRHMRAHDALLVLRIGWICSDVHFASLC